MIKITSLTLILILYFSISYSQTKYVFNGNGKWSDTANWVNRMIPPELVHSGDSILVAPLDNGECLLDVPIYLRDSTFFEIAEGKKFRIVGEFAFNVKAPVDSLSDKDADILASLKDTVIHLNEIFLENHQDVLSYMQANDPGFLSHYQHRPTGNMKVAKTASTLTQQEQKTLFIARMTVMGDYLVTRDNHTYTAGATNEPAQVGLAYSYGSKDFSLRQYPPAGDCRSEKIYGLDCSGMVYALTTSSFLPAVVPRGSFSVSNISNLSKWDTAFINSDYDSLRIEDRGQVARTDLQVGDIIIWPSAPHIGICLGTAIYLSNGSGKLPRCQNNLDNDKGPRTVPITDAWLSEFGGGVYTVFRVSDDNFFTDLRDGQIYSKKKIGTQVWMTQNLNFLTANSDCYLDDPNYCSIYGSLYNFEEALAAVPPGWHLPTREEWNTLADFLGGDIIVGPKLKVGGRWLQFRTFPLAGITNSSGFSALPGGFEDTNFTGYNKESIGGYWWSSTEYLPQQVNRENYTRILLSDSNQFPENSYSRNGKLSVRCIKD